MGIKLIPILFALVLTTPQTLSPVITFSSPSRDGLVLSGTVHLEASAIDDSEICVLYFSIDGNAQQVVNYLSPFPKTGGISTLLDTYEYPDGAHVIEVTICDLVNCSHSIRNVTFKNIVRDGIDGINGTNGTNGLPGINGTNGIDGKDGDGFVSGAYLFLETTKTAPTNYTFISTFTLMLDSKKKLVLNLYKKN